MALLSRRFEGGLVEHGFKANDLQKIWTSLYAFRSEIARGAESDFSK